MDEQEIRAKSLEIAVQIIGRKKEIEPAEEQEYEVDDNTGEKKVIHYLVPQSLIEHYRPLASEVDAYIRGAYPAKKPS